MSPTDGATKQDSETGPNKGVECTYGEHVLCCVRTLPWTSSAPLAFSPPQPLPTSLGTFALAIPSARNALPPRYPHSHSSTSCCSVAQSCLTLCGLMNCSTPGSPSFTISWSLLKLMSNESVMPSNHLILCHPLLLLPSIFPSTRVSSNESALHIRWPKNTSCKPLLKCHLIRKTSPDHHLMKSHLQLSLHHPFSLTLRSFTSYSWSLPSSFHIYISGGFSVYCLILQICSLTKFRGARNLISHIYCCVPSSWNGV